MQLFALAFSERSICDLAHQGVLEHPLARAREARNVLLHQYFGGHERFHHALGARHAERLECRVPTRQAEHAQTAHGVTAFFVEGIQADLDRRFDRRCVCGVTPRSAQTRQFLSKKRQTGGLLGDPIDDRLRHVFADHGARDGTRGARRDRSQLEAYVVATREAVGLLGPELGSHEGHHHQGAARGAAQHVIEPADALRICPLQILHQNRGLLVGGDLQHEIGHGQPQDVARAARIEAFGQRLIGQQAREQLAVLGAQLVARRWSEARHDGFGGLGAGRAFRQGDDAAQYVRRGA